MARSERDIILTPPAHADGPTSVRSSTQRSLLGSMLMAPVEVFSSIRLGIVLLAILFVYSSVGSSGVPMSPLIWKPEVWLSVRQLRAFELTEFQWFNWWPFTTLIVLICVNIVVATFRRIPFTALRLGAWIIHSGILILAAGSIWYFSTKVEGSAPVHRRTILIQAPGEEAATLVASPGNVAQIGPPGRQWRFRVQSIDPQWELLTGDAAGTRAFSVMVAVLPPAQNAKPFIRQIIAGRPDLTEDLLFTEDPKQPMQRAKKVRPDGRSVVDDTLSLSLEYAPQEYFYLNDSRAIYLREIRADGSQIGPWIERRVLGLPIYNDYLATADDAWVGAGEQLPPLDPLHVEVPASDPHDPLPDVSLSISRYLRYAFMDSRLQTLPNAAINPTALVRVQSEDGRSEQHELQVNDPDKALAADGNLQLLWIRSGDELSRLLQPPSLHVAVVPPGLGTTPAIPDAGPNATQPQPPATQPHFIDIPINTTLARDQTLQFQTVPGTDYSFRVERIQPRLQLPGGPATVAIVEFKNADRHFRRWVFQRPELAKDFALTPDSAAHDQELPTDSQLLTAIVPPELVTAPVAVLMGPAENDLAVIVNFDLLPSHQPVQVGQPVALGGGVTLRVEQASLRPVRIQKPFIVPRNQRNRNVEAGLSMVQLDVRTPAAVSSAWLSYHEFAFQSPGDALRRFPYRPAVLQLPMADGSVKTIEFMFSRARMKLPAPVALDDFVLDAHVGGYTGDASILDWTSHILFNQDGRWSSPRTVSVNKPKEFEGFWFYQAQWDPPDPARFSGDTNSLGLNYTVLGVGNRNGVNIQLAGCCIAVFGMIYAFYIKPVIRNRRQAAVKSRLPALQQAAAHKRASEKDMLLAEHDS